MRQATQKKNHVVITGMGVITALGFGVAALQKALREGTSAFKKSREFAELTYPVICATIDDFHFDKVLANFDDTQNENKLRILKVGQRAPKVIQTSLVAALEAFSQAKIWERHIDPTRIGLVVAGHNTTQRYSYDLRHSFQAEPSYLSPSYALHFMDTDQVGHLSEAFQIQGEGLSVGGASASGNIGLIQAYRMIQHGIIDVCLVVGVMADLSPMEVQGFQNIGAMGGKRFAETPAQASRPFDLDHEGFIWGQGSGCVVLESKALAKRDKILILGEIEGSAIALDAHRHSQPNILGESRVMQLAIDDAKKTTHDIQYINTHGSSSGVGDEVEVNAICEVFKNKANTIWLNSTKSIIGHCLWSAGIIEVIASIVQMQAGFLHPNLNLDNPINPLLRWVGKKAETVKITNALSNSFGFGGINSSILITQEN